MQTVMNKAIKILENEVKRQGQTFVCPLCGKEFTNPEIFRLHEDGCFQAQKENRIIREDK